MANTKVTGDLIAAGTITTSNIANGTITATNIASGGLDSILSTYLTTNTYATEGYVTTAVANLVDAAPSTLDTLNELAAALGDDPNFATTVTNSIATKLPLAGGTLKGDLIVNANVGIGTSSPTEKLHITDSSDFIVRLQRVGVQELQLKSDGSVVAGSADLKLISTSNVLVTAGGSERLRIDSSGNVGIGMTPFVNSLNTGNIDLANGGGIWGWSKGSYVTGNTYFDSNWKYKEAGYGSILHINGNDGDFRFFTMPYSGTAGVGGTPTERMRIDASGNVGIGTSSPTNKLNIAGNDSTVGLQVTGGTNGRNVLIGAGGIVFRSTNLYGWGIELSMANNDGSSKFSTIAGAFGDAETFSYNYYGGTAYNDAAIYIPSSKNVGINTASPSATLHVNQGTFKHSVSYGNTSSAVKRFYIAESAFNNPTMQIISSTSATGSYPQISLHVKMHGRGFSANRAQYSEFLVTVDMTGSTLQNLQQTVISHTTLSGVVAAGSFSISGSSLFFYS